MYGHMLNQTITVKNAASVNDYGETVSEDAGETISARVERVNKSIVTQQASTGTGTSGTGELIPIAAEAFVDPSVDVDAGDTVVYEDENYLVEAKDEIPDGQGVVRLVVLKLKEYR